MEVPATAHASVHVADARVVLHHPSVIAAEERMLSDDEAAPRDLRCLVSRRVLLRLALGAHRPDDLTFASGPCLHCGGSHGRLRAQVAGAGEVHVSLSSHGRYVAVVTSPDAHVGIRVRDRSSPGTAAPDELLHDTDEPSVDPIRVWARKGALLKASGEGLRTPYDSFAATGQDIGTYEGVHLHDVDVPRYPDVVLAVGVECAGRPQIDVHVR